MVKELKIKNVKIKNNIFLAPLAGVTDFAFRFLAREFGAGLTYTEMVSAKALSFDNEKTKNLTYLASNESPSAVQIFGSEWDIMSKMIDHESIKPFDIIDINMGCPVNKIVSNGEGSALMKDLNKASKIISACASATNKPVTVKFRKGFDDNNINGVEFAKMCEDSGASLITIHGRTRQQMYEGKADREFIAKVKNAVSIPVIANGDIDSKASMDDMFEKTGCDGVMVGRGSLGRPWIFAELLGKKVDIDIVEIINLHIDMLMQVFDERFVVTNMRKHIGWYLKGIRNGKRIKDNINRLLTVREIKEELENSKHEIIR